VSEFESFPSSKSESGKRIVVVDALKGAGYEVETAAEGGQALRLMSERAHLHITDLFMPGLEGFETIARRRADYPRTTIMVISAGRMPGMNHDFPGGQARGYRAAGTAAALTRNPSSSGFARASACIRGRRALNTVPPSSEDSATMVPPCIVTISCAM
jgi:CheY-like chemotaxis protein